MSTERPNYFAHLLQVSKQISLKSDFIQFFHAFIRVFNPGRSRQPLGDDIFIST